MLLDILFYFICIIHVIVWSFVMLGFFNKKMAFINVYFLIPFIYLLHLLPFHIMIASKEKIYPKKNKEKTDKFLKLLFIDRFNVFYEKLEKYCFKNPLSAQGMLIFGLITSVYRLYPIF